MTSTHQLEHDEDDDDDEDVSSVPCGRMVSWGARKFRAEMSELQACVFFCNWTKFWYLYLYEEMDPSEHYFKGEIMWGDVLESSSYILKSFAQLKSFTDDNGNPKGIPGFLGLHAILDEISDKKTRKLLSLNHALPTEIRRMRVALLFAETMRKRSFPARLESVVTRCVLQIAADYAGEQNLRKRKHPVETHGNNTGPSAAIVSGSNRHEFTASGTENRVFFCDWQSFWHEWLLGYFKPNENVFDGTIMKNGAVFMQLESFTDGNGKPKKILGFPGLYAILDEISNNEKVRHLLSFDVHASNYWIETMRASLWLAELMQTLTPATDHESIVRVKNALSLLRGKFDWEKYYWSSFIHLQMVFRVIASEHNLPKDILDSIAGYLLPEQLKSAIANCVFQIALDYHREFRLDGYYLYLYQRNTSDVDSESQYSM